MSDWSSFEEDKRITDAWRSYLKEDLADVMSGYVGGIKNTTDTGAEPETTKGPKGTFYRNILAEVTVLISNIANRIGVQIDTEIIVEEFEKMITDQNFELAEQVSAGKAFTGEGTPLNFLPERHPELTKFIAAVKQSKYLKNFSQSLAQAGFGGDSIKAVLGKPAPPRVTLQKPTPDQKPPDQKPPDQKSPDQDAELGPEDEEAKEVEQPDGEGEKPYPQKEEPFVSRTSSEEGEEGPGTKLLDKIQHGLDVLGVANLIPGGQIISEPATAASLLLNLSRSKYDMALLDLIGLVPFVGGAAKAGKLGARASKLAKMEKVTDAIKKAEKVNKPILVQKAFNSLMSELEPTKVLDIIDGTIETLEDNTDINVKPFKKAWEERKEGYIKFKAKKRRAGKRKRTKQARGFEENQQRIISESLEQRWQTIAGIKKRVA